jgi:hypothetical protein
MIEGGLVEEKISRHVKIVNRDKKYESNQLQKVLFFKFGFPNERKSPSIVKLDQNNNVKGYTIRLPHIKKDKYAREYLNNYIKNFTKKSNIDLNSDLIGEELERIKNSNYWYPHIRCKNPKNGEFISCIRKISNDYNITK